MSRSRRSWILVSLLLPAPALAGPWGPGPDRADFPLTQGLSAYIDRGEIRSVSLASPGPTAMTWEVQFDSRSGNYDEDDYFADTFLKESGGPRDRAAGRLSRTAPSKAEEADAEFHLFSKLPEPRRPSV